MSIGDVLVISDGNGIDYNCTISNTDENIVTATILHKQVSNVESKINIILYQAIPKGDKLDFIVQKAVELGVYSIIPFDTKRCVSRPDEKSKVKKTERLNKIALEAAKQCGRSFIPTVTPFMSFLEALEHAKSNDINLMFYENGGIRINDALKSFTGTSIGIFIGSEGGFESDEVEQIASINSLGNTTSVCTLGKLILRCETAGLASISIIKNILGDI